MGRTRESPCTDRLLKQGHGKAAANLVLGSGNTHEGNCCCFFFAGSSAAL
jgi:hypothetical protein